jgi:hypothetical protein
VTKIGIGANAIMLKPMIDDSAETASAGKRLGSVSIKKSSIVAASLFFILSCGDSVVEQSFISQEAQESSDLAAQNDEESAVGVAGRTVYLTSRRATLRVQIRSAPDCLLARNGFRHRCQRRAGSTCFRGTRQPVLR